MHVQSLPGDFLTTMEEYVRDVPKTMDASNVGRKGGSGPPPAMVRASSHAARGGTTSSALGERSRTALACLQLASPSAAPVHAWLPAKAWAVQ